jgi:hypothetical protein
MTGAINPTNQELPEETPSIAYTVSLYNGTSFDVLTSANAWWMDKSKIDRLINAFSIGATIEIACLHAGITVRQYKYFLSLHPDFTHVRKIHTVLPKLKALKTVSTALEHDSKLAYKYIEKRMPNYVSASQNRLGESHSSEVDPVEEEAEAEDFYKNDRATQAAIEAYNRVHHEQVLAEIDAAPDEMEDDYQPPSVKYPNVIPVPEKSSYIDPGTQEEVWVSSEAEARKQLQRRIREMEEIENNKPQKKISDNWQ